MLIWIEEDREELVKDNSQGLPHGLRNVGRGPGWGIGGGVMVAVSLGVEEITNTLGGMQHLRGLCSSSSRSCVCTDALDSSKSSGLGGETEYVSAACLLAVDPAAEGSRLRGHSPSRVETGPAHPWQLCTHISVAQEAQVGRKLPGL